MKTAEFCSVPTAHRTQHKVEAIRCKGCGRVGLAVDDLRVTNHKCAGAWEVVAEAVVSFGPDAEIQGASASLIEREDGRILCVWNQRYEGWVLPGGMATPESIARGGVENVSPNADFLAHARQDVPALLARVRELEERLKEIGTLAAVPGLGSYGEAFELLERIRVAALSVVP